MDHSEVVWRNEVDRSTHEALDDGWGRVSGRTGPWSWKLTI